MSTIPKLSVKESMWIIPLHPALHSAMPKNLTDLSMLTEATNEELWPNLTPVAAAVWSLNTASSFHCLHRNTLSREAKQIVYHFFKYFHNVY